MKEQLLDIQEITYSREMYEAKPRPFVSVFIYLFLLIILGALIWTYMSEIDIVARGNGIVRPSENVNTVRVEYTGKLEEVNVTEGKQVEKGDILYVVEHKALLLQEEELQEKIDDIKQKRISLQAYEKSIINGKASFNEASRYNDYYQIKYENYQKNLEYINYQKASTKLQLKQSNQTDLISNQLDTLKEKYNRMLTLKQSIKQGTNLIVDASYQGQYEDYANTVKQYESELNHLETSLEKSKALYEAGYISQSEHETTAHSLRTKQLTYNQFKINHMTSLEESIKQTKDSINQYEEELSIAEVTGELLYNEETSGESVVEKYRLDNLVMVQDEIKTYEDELDSLEANLKNTRIQIDGAIITAPISGKVNLLAVSSKGDYVSVGTELLTIIQDNQAGYSVDIALPNSEVAGIEVGDVVKFKFSALPFKEYGEFTGTIEQISTDIKSDNSGTSYYLVEAKLTDIEVVSYKGEKRNIKVGMACEAHVIKEQKKILYWLLEKINLKD
jgi:HlyD family secretion protein